MSLKVSPKAIVGDRRRRTRAVRDRRQLGRQSDRREEHHDVPRRGHRARVASTPSSPVASSSPTPPPASSTSPTRPSAASWPSPTGSARWSGVGRRWCRWWWCSASWRPLIGIGLDRLIMRRLKDASLVVQLMVTVGLMLVVHGHHPHRSGSPRRARTLPQFFRDTERRQDRRRHRHLAPHHHRARRHRHRRAAALAALPHPPRHLDAGRRRQPQPRRAHRRQALRSSAARRGPSAA